MMVDLGGFWVSRHIDATNLPASDKNEYHFLADPLGQRLYHINWRDADVELC
jgi:hypothetical protein